MRLTENCIRTHKRPKSGQIFAWDDLVSGFGVRFTRTATAYVVQWRASDGAKRRVTLKRWPATSVDDARNLARAHLSSAIEVRDAGGDVPLRAAMRGWFRRQAAAKQWRPRYEAKVNSIIRMYVEGESTRIPLKPTARKAIDLLGRKAVSHIKRSDVLAVADNIRRGAADQFLGIVSSFYGYANEREWTDTNPAKNRLRVIGGRRVRHRTPTDKEILQLWEAFQKEGDPAFGAFALLLFTGMRRRECTGLRHDELDLDAGTLTLPAERRKTGKIDPEPFVIHLHPGAIAILRRQPELEGNDHVFWGQRDRRPFDFHHALLDRVRKNVKVTDWRLHDIRRYVRSGMGRLGISQAVSEMCLGHSAKAGLVKIYDQHNYSGEKHQAWRRWGDHLVALLKIGTP